MAWYLTFHIFGFIFWMGGLLDLTRILGYHVKEELNVQERLSWMEFRMFFFVTTPGMVLTYIMGILLFLHGGGVDTYFAGGRGWFHAKATLILLITVVHIFTGREILKLRAHPQKINPARFKAIHGITGLMLTAILILVMVKPF